MLLLWYYMMRWFHGIFVKNCKSNIPQFGKKIYILPRKTFNGIFATKTRQQRIFFFCQKKCRSISPFFVKSFQFSYFLTKKKEKKNSVKMRILPNESCLSYSEKNLVKSIYRMISWNQLLSIFFSKNVDFTEKMITFP